MLTAVLGVLGGLTAWFAVVFGLDFSKNKNNLEDNAWSKVISIGFVTNFFDTLGIGSFAPTTALLKGFKQTKDRVIPGTLNEVYRNQKSGDIKRAVLVLISKEAGVNIAAELERA